MTRINPSRAAFLNPAILALSRFLIDALERRLEPIRTARTAVALMLAGSNANSLVIRKACTHLLKAQVDNSGWSDPEESAWAIGAIRGLGEEEKVLTRSATEWLHAVRHPDGGWGLHPRDKARIKTTALISALVPDVIMEKDTQWLAQEWRKDFSSPVRLSYKAGFFLLAISNGSEDNLITQTINHLADDQNEDGGFGPWKGHPMGSDPWSTGVVLWGLSKWIENIDIKVIEKAINWLKKTQLPNGYWPYHYLDDGTSMALIGAISALKALAGKN